jgi:hypothetical protein
MELCVTTSEVVMTFKESIPRYLNNVNAEGGLKD